MFNRKRFNWSVTLQSSLGEVIDYPVSSYWSPDKEGCAEAIGRAAKGMSYWASNKTKTYEVIAVTRKS